MSSDAKPVKAPTITATAAQLLQRIPMRGAQVMRDPLMAPAPRVIDDPDQMSFEELFPEYPRGPHVRREP